jgi:hypothetical protein
MVYVIYLNNAVLFKGLKNKCPFGFISLMLVPTISCTFFFPLGLLLGSCNLNSWLLSCHACITLSIHAFHLIIAHVKLLQARLISGTKNAAGPGSR